MKSVREQMNQISRGNKVVAMVTKLATSSNSFKLLLCTINIEQKKKDFNYQTTKRKGCFRPLS